MLAEPQFFVIEYINHVRCSTYFGFENKNYVSTIQVWNSQSVSLRVDASTPHTNTSGRTKSRRPVPETVADDAWQTAPRKPQFVSSELK